MKIIAATKNKGKIKEIQKILGNLGFEVVTQTEAGINADPEENGTTFSENALIKARAVFKECQEYVLADDSGLCVDAIGGRPGVYSARYAGEGASDGEKISKLLTELEDKEDRKAHFETCVAFITPDGKEFIAEGKVNGYIVYEPEGDNGFGYDPVFFCDELGKTFAKATDDEKNSVSHRGRALRKLYEQLKTNGF